MDCTRLLRWNCKTFITIVGVSLCVISVVSAQPVRDDSDIVATFRGGTLTLGQVRAHIFMTKTKELAFSKDLVMERVWSDPQRRMRGIETVAFDTMLGTYARQNNIPLSAEQEPFYKAERDLLFSRMYYEEKVKPVIEQERATFKPGYRSYYESHLNDYRLPDRYSYRQVVLSASSEAGWEQLAKSKLEDALQRIVNGEDFREIAQGISSATESPKGSVIGPVESTEVEPEFRVVFARMEEGQVSRVFKVGDSLVLLKLESRQQGGVRPYEEVLPSLEKQGKLDKFMPERVTKRLEDDLISQYPFEIFQDRISTLPEDAQKSIVQTDLVRIINDDILNPDRPLFKEEPDEKIILGAVKDLYSLRLKAALADQERLQDIPFYKQALEAQENFHLGQSLLKEMVKGKRFSGLPNFTPNYLQTVLRDYQVTLVQ